VRYAVAIEIRHLAHGDPLSEAARLALRASAVDHFRRDNSTVALSDVGLTARQHGIVVLHATLAGKSLTSPLTALTQLDEALRRGLMSTGLFEEFDVSRRRLEVWSA
jgi:hypothetical protein